MTKKEFFRKELKVENANPFQKLWYNINEKLLMDVIDKYNDTDNWVCLSNKGYSDCEIHADNIGGCLECGNFVLNTDC